MNRLKSHSATFNYFKIKKLIRDHKFDLSNPIIKLNKNWYLIYLKTDKTLVMDVNHRYNKHEKYEVGEIAFPKTKDTATLNMALINILDRYYETRNASLLEALNLNERSNDNV